jgi:hypothetical protein
VRIRKMGAALALGGALAVSALAIAGPADAATAGHAKPAEWTYSGHYFINLSYCQAYGQYLKNEGEAQAYNCSQDDLGLWYLYIFVS